MKQWLLEKRRRIIIAGMVVTALPVISIALYVYIEVATNIEDMILSENRQTAEAVSVHIEETVNNDIIAGKLLASRVLLQRAIEEHERKEITRHLKNFVENVISIERVFISDKEGVLLANYTETINIIGKNFSDRDWYKGVSRKWEPYVTEFYMRAGEPKRYIFSIAVPIRTAEQKPIGILGLQPEKDYIRNAIKHIAAIKGREIYVTDAKGNLIYHSDFEIDRIMAVSGEPPVKKALKGESGAVKMAIKNGENMIAFYHPVKTFGWAVVVRRSPKEVFAPLRRITGGFFVFSALMLLAGFFATSRMSSLMFSLKKLSDELEARVEERTRESARSEKQYRDLVSNTAVGVYKTNIKGEFLFANRALADMYEFESPVELMSAGAAARYKNPGDRERLIDLLLKNGRVEHFDVDMVTRTGALKHIIFNATLEDDVLSGMVFDITERQRAEDEVQKSEERFRALAAASADVIYRMSPDWSEMRHLAGKDFIEDTAEPSHAWLKKYIHPKDQERVMTAVHEAIRNKSVFELEHQVLRVDGTLGWTFSRAIPILDAHGEIIEWFGMAQDITDRKLAENKLKEYSEHLEDMVAERTKELEDANKELQTLNVEIEQRRAEAELARLQADAANKGKSDFLANMSHELRTPLNAIIGFAEVLEDQFYGQINQKQKEYVSNIQSGGRHLLSLINDILDLSKVESGKMDFEPAPVKLKETLETSLNLFCEKALKHGIRMEIEVAPEADIEIEADERKLKQILFNLLSNAVKFTPDGGSVRVSARLVRSSEFGVKREEGNVAERRTGHAERDGDSIEISVSDTGIGIKPGDLPKLFQEFTQLESAYTKGYEGTGLGLALTKRLVELHGGRIWAESTYGKGSRFTFVIPMRQG